jgi:phospholipid/cholesterol/gamma-HCH transport system permease protein
MKPDPADTAKIESTNPELVTLSGPWTARTVGSVSRQAIAIEVTAQGNVLADCARINGLDTAGAWVLSRLVERLASGGATVTRTGLRPQFEKRLVALTGQTATMEKRAQRATGPPQSHLWAIGRNAHAGWTEALHLLAFLGECACTLLRGLSHPSTLRWRPALFNLRSAGVDALPIVGTLSFMLGVVVAYQGADQLRQYGANIFVADLVGLSILREFAPLITAIIIAGRSGSAYAAQIGTMAVTEEIDALRTLGIDPIELLVLPKVMALLIALPLLTVCADILGVAGGMVMAKSQLGISHTEFMDRFVKAVRVTAYLIGIGKAPVFACIISIVGCFQGFRTRGGADSVGRQTTRAVVQTIFLVIAVDGLFSVIFSALDL